MISKAPWHLLPLAWAWTGTSETGFFVIGHDCTHISFSKNKLVEDIVGNLAFLPVIYPYEPWQYKHDRHHAKTNMLYEDTACHPAWKEEFDSSPLLWKAIIHGYGPFRTWMSIAHWVEILCHDINVDIPHHISPRIPSYNFRAAHKSLQENWGKYLNEASWNWRLMRSIMTVCHVYDREQNYVAFDELAPEESSPITFLRKVTPDYA